MVQVVWIALVRVLTFACRLSGLLVTPHRRMKVQFLGRRLLLHPVSHQGTHSRDVQVILAFLQQVVNAAIIRLKFLHFFLSLLHKGDGLAVRFSGLCDSFSSLVAKMNFFGRHSDSR